MTPSHVRELLEATDARLRRSHGGFLTLDPQREHAHSLAAIAARLLSPKEPLADASAFCRALSSIAESQLEHFPENLFWDLDYLAAVVLRELHARGREAMWEHCELIMSLQRAFGCHSRIRFHYLHDFLYGFDWERFVRRQPQARAGIGPFDRPFLLHVLSRAQEIVAAIERGDPQYPPLPPGQWRNPFPFSRQPDDEVRLHRALLRCSRLPVQAYRADSEPDASRPYTREREACARALGLSQPAAAD